MHLFLAVAIDLALLFLECRRLLEAMNLSAAVDL